MQKSQSKLLHELLLLIVSNSEYIKVKNKSMEFVRVDKIKTWCRINNMSYPDELPF